ncbi:DUF2079 domain-containing protein [Streptomyces sp. NPDC057539]|uniref:DUF2079 domain-containing protein n=1 Tax=Streptomyces sp. NPDC057539 TaxID=3346159 RepID=UPI003675B499
MHGVSLVLPGTGTPAPPSTALPEPAASPTRTVRVRDPYVVAVVLFCAYAALSISRYLQLRTMSWDLGIFEQVIRAYAQLEAPVADLKGPGVNILGDHFSPVVALLAPVYRLFPTPVTLLVAQAALFALSAIPVTRVAARLLGRWPGVAIGVGYGLSWGVQRAVEFDFHEIAFAVPLIAFALEALLTGRRRAALCWALPLVLVKEDLGLTAAAIALVVAVRARRTAPRVVPDALAVAALAVVAAVLTFAFVIPAFNSGDTYDYWVKVEGGSGPLDGFDVKFRTLLWLLLPTAGLLALRSPLMLIALPTLGWRFLSAEDNYWGTAWHYNAVLMPIVTLALVDAIVRVCSGPRAWLRSYAHHLPAMVAAAALALTTSLPLSALAEPDTYRVRPEVRAAERLLDSIPDDATVEANVGPISLLTSRCRVFWVGDTRGITPDYIALDNRTRWVGDPVAYAKRLHPRATYTVTGEVGGYLVLERATGAE